MLQQSKRLAYYTYTLRFIFDRRKRICNNNNEKDNSKSCHQRSSLAGDNNYSKTHIHSTVENNATTITPQNSNYFQHQAMPEKPSPAAPINGLTVTSRHLSSSSNKGQPNSINGNYCQNTIGSLTASTTTLGLYKPLSTKVDNNKYYNESINTVQSSVRWPPRKDIIIDDVVERTLSNKLVKLWKQHEISMEKYTEFFPGQPSLRRSRHQQYRRYYGRKCEKNNDDTPLVLSKEQPKSQVLPRLEQGQQHDSPSSFSKNYSDNHPLLSLPSSSRSVINSHDNYDDSHNRHKLYLLAREVLLYYEKEYGSQRGGTPEAKQILFLRQAISNFTSTN